MRQKSIVHSFSKPSLLETLKRLDGLNIYCLLLNKILLFQIATLLSYLNHEGELLRKSPQIDPKIGFTLIVIYKWHWSIWWQSCKWSRWKYTCCFWLTDETFHIMITLLEFSSAHQVNSPANNLNIMSEIIFSFITINKN